MQKRTLFSKYFGEITKCKRMTVRGDVDNVYMKVGLHDQCGDYIPGMFKWYRINNKGDIYVLDSNTPDKNSKNDGKLLAPLGKGKHYKSWLHYKCHIRPVEGYSRLVADISIHTFVAAAWGLMDDIQDILLDTCEIHHKVKYILVDDELEHITNDSPSNLVIMFNKRDHAVCDKLYDICVSLRNDKRLSTSIQMDLDNIIFKTGVSYDNMLDVISLIGGIKGMSTTVYKQDSLDDIKNELERDEYDF
jgi:hypothetical protein